MTDKQYEKFMKKIAKSNKQYYQHALTVCGKCRLFKECFEHSGCNDCRGFKEK